MHQNYAKTEQWAKAIDAGEKVLGIDGTDHEVAFGNLKAAEALKGLELIRKWAVRSSDVSRKVIESAAPADEEEKEQWKQAVERAKGMDTYSEYALFTAAAGILNQPKELTLLVETLEARNPKSQYLGQIYAPYVYALQQSGEKDKAIASAENAIQNGHSNEDLLILVAGSYIEKKSPEKVLEYASQVVQNLESKPKPENIGDADWEKKKNALLGGAHFMMGVTYSGQNKLAEADKSLRAALPLIAADQQTQAEALFHLGLVNYKLSRAQKNKARMKDALTFTQQCAAIKGRFQAQANKNLAVIKSDPLSR
jgi:tetratricopeptide (TPR) repeat protein